jgi:hypothetical protein
MTAQQETLFICNRCRDSTTVPLANGPITTRSAPPEGWVTLWVDDQTRAPAHLCPPCAFGFNAYMSDATLTVKPKPST